MGEIGAMLNHLGIATMLNCYHGPKDYNDEALDIDALIAHGVQGGSIDSAARYVDEITGDISLDDDLFDLDDLL